MATPTEEEEEEGGRKCQRGRMGRGGEARQEGERDCWGMLRYLLSPLTWALVGVALAHHDAAQRDERGRREAKLLGTQQRCDGNVTPGAQLTVHLGRREQGEGGGAGDEGEGAGIKEIVSRSDEGSAWTLRQSSEHLTIPPY